MIGLVKTVGANTSNNLELPGTDSQDATDLLAKRFPPQQNGKNPIVFHSPEDNGKVTDAENKQAIQDVVVKAAKQLPHVFSATSPFSQQGQAQISKDEQTAFITVLLDIGNEEVTEGLAQRFLKAAESRARKAGMKVGGRRPDRLGAVRARDREQRRDRPVRGDGDPHASPSGRWWRWGWRSSRRSWGCWSGCP